MRRARIGMLALAIVALAGCGGGSHFADKPRPATPVNVSIYIGNAHVSVSPTSVGAGTVIFTITNQATRAETVSIKPASGGSALATTAPINPQATSQVTVDFHPGTYKVSTSTQASANAVVAGTTVQPASLRVGQARSNANNALLEP